MPTITVKAVCTSCKGTGLYSGFAEPKGTAVVCITCKGSGCQEITYEPFTNRKPKDGIHTVRLSHGSIVLSCGPTGSTISYNDFTNGKMTTR